MASRSPRDSQRCSIGSPEQHQPGGHRAGAADQRGQRDGAGVPVVGDLRGVLDGVLHQAEPVVPAPLDVGHDRRAPGRRTARRAERAEGSPGSDRQHAGPAHAPPAPVAGAARAARWPAVAVLLSTPASLIGRAEHGGTVARVSPSRRCSRAACGRPAVATLTYVYADQTAVLGPLAPARRAARLRPVRAAQRAAVGPARLGGAAAGPRPVAGRSLRATTCSPSPTRSARPPARRRGSSHSSGPEAEPGSGGVRRGHLRVLTPD